MRRTILVSEQHPNDLSHNQCGLMQGASERRSGGVISLGSVSFYQANHNRLSAAAAGKV